MTTYKIFLKDEKSQEINPDKKQKKNKKQELWVESPKRIRTLNRCEPRTSMSMSQSDSYQYIFSLLILKPSSKKLNSALS